MQNVTEAELAKVMNEGKKILVFGATWCKPCEALKPVLDQVSAELFDVEFYHVDVDKESKVAIQSQVRGVPTVVMYKNGVEKRRFVGALTSSRVKEEIKNAYA